MGAEYSQWELSNLIANGVGDIADDEINTYIIWILKQSICYGKSLVL